MALPNLCCKIIHFSAEGFEKAYPQHVICPGFFSFRKQTTSIVTVGQMCTWFLSKSLTWFVKLIVLGRVQGRRIKLRNSAQPAFTLLITPSTPKVHFLPNRQKSSNVCIQKYNFLLLLFLMAMGLFCFPVLSFIGYNCTY